MIGDIIYHRCLGLSHPTLSSHKDVHCENEEKGEERIWKLTRHVDFEDG